VSRVEAVIAEQLPFVFTDRHSLATYARWSDREADLDGLDWETIYTDNWANNAEDRERKNRKQAEFLVHAAVPITLCHEVAVFSPSAKVRVEALTRASGRNIPTVVVRPRWCY
jgi:hypothetical protein